MTPPDNNPEIPSFKKDQDKDKKGGGAPMFGRGATGAKPILKIRGLSAGTTLVERLKQFKKKDIAFILSGLGVLFMAPLAEHFILGPSDESKILNRGFDSKGNVFSEANPYEPGTGGFSPGGLPGQGTDVITPLNVRDPSALVMGPGANQTPPATTPPKEEKKDNSSWKDALVEAGRAGARGASASAGLPTPRGALSGALRGLSALGGGGGGGPSFSLPPVSANNVPNKAAGGHNMLNVAGAPGYKGVANRGISQGGNDDALKKAGENAAGLFNRSGSAANNLDQAAREAIPAGGGRADSQGNGPGGGAGSKDPGGNQNKDNKSMGESLAFLRAKMIMEKQLDLDFKKKEWREFEMYKTIQQKIVEQTITDILGKGFTQPAGYMISNYIMGKLGGTVGWMCSPINPTTGQPVAGPPAWVPGAVCQNCQTGKATDVPPICNPLCGQNSGQFNCNAVDGQGNTTAVKPNGQVGGVHTDQAPSGLGQWFNFVSEGGLDPAKYCSTDENKAICATPNFKEYLQRLSDIGKGVDDRPVSVVKNGAAAQLITMRSSYGNATAAIKTALPDYMAADDQILAIINGTIGDAGHQDGTIYSLVQKNNKPEAETKYYEVSQKDSPAAFEQGNNGDQATSVALSNITQAIDAGRAADAKISDYRTKLEPPALTGDAAKVADQMKTAVEVLVNRLQGKLGKAATDVGELRQDFPTKVGDVQAKTTKALHALSDVVLPAANPEAFQDSTKLRENLKTLSDQVENLRADTQQARNEADRNIPWANSLPGAAAQAAVGN